MSKEMKNFLSQFIAQPDPAAIAVLETKVIEKNEPVAIPEKAATPKAEKKAPAKPTVKPAAKPVAKLTADTEGGGDAAQTVAHFLAAVNDRKFTFEKKKNLQIDDQLFNVLTLLKQHQDIKSITNLLNAIVEKYIADNKTELKTILSKNPLNNF